jgi:two-component system sensor histidine kinase FlrB
MAEQQSESSVQPDAWFNTLAKLSDTGVVLVAMNGDVEFASERACALLGCSGDDAIDSCTRILQEPLKSLLNDDRDVPDPAEAVGEFKVEVPSASGPQHISANIHQVDVAACAGYLIILQDIGARERAAEDLMLAARMRNIGRSYQALAHDLRTPVSAILLHLQNMANFLDRETQLGEERRRKLTEYMDTIKQGVQMLDKSLQNILHELAPTQKHRSSFNMRDLLLEIAEIINGIAKQRHIRISIRVCDQDLLVEGHRDRLKHAIMNLCANAIEAMEDKGELRLALTPAGQNMLIEIGDNGPGIAAQVQEKMFERYFTTKISGTGIGLAVAKEAVVKDGGNLEYKTSPGEGTTFTITLPRVRNMPEDERKL